MRWPWRSSGSWPWESWKPPFPALDGPSSLHAWDFYHHAPRPCLQCGRMTVVLLEVERRGPCDYTNNKCLRWGMNEYCQCSADRRQVIHPQTPRNPWVDRATGDICPACAIELVGFDTVLHWSWTEEATVSQWLASRRGPLGAPPGDAPRFQPAPVSIDEGGRVRIDEGFLRRARGLDTRE